MGHFVGAVGVRAAASAWSRPSWRPRTLVRVVSRLFSGFAGGAAGQSVVAALGVELGIALGRYAHELGLLSRAARRRHIVGCRSGDRQKACRVAMFAIGGEECSVCPGEPHCARPLRRHAAGRLGGSSMAGSLCEGLEQEKASAAHGRRPLSGFSSTCVSRRRYSRRPPAGSTREARRMAVAGRDRVGGLRRARASSPRRRIRRGYRIRSS